MRDALSAVAVFGWPSAGVGAVDSAATGDAVRLTLTADGRLADPATGRVVAELPADPTPSDGTTRLVVADNGRPAAVGGDAAVRVGLTDGLVPIAFDRAEVGGTGTRLIDYQRLTGDGMVRIGGRPVAVG